MPRVKMTRALGIAFVIALCCTGLDALIVESRAQSRGQSSAVQAPAPQLTFAFELRATVAGPPELGQVACELVLQCGVHSSILPTS